MSGVIIAGNKGNFAEVTDDGKLKVETAAELTLESIELELQGAIETTSNSVVKDVVIAAAGTQSTEIDFRKYKYLAFLMPSAWTSATLTLKGSAVEGGTKVAIKNDTNTAFPAMTVAVDTLYSVDVNALMIVGLHFLAFESSAPQDAERTIKVICKS